MKILYLVRSRNAEGMESWGNLAQAQARLGYDVRIYPWFQPKQLAPLLLRSAPAVLHLVGPPRFPLHRFAALQSARPFTLVLEAPGPEPGSWPQNLVTRAFGSRGAGFGPVIAGGVARSRAERLLLEKAWGLAGSQILCLSPGVDASRFCFQPELRRQWRERLGLGLGEALLLQVGPLDSVAAARRMFAAGREPLQKGRAVLALTGAGPAAFRRMLEAQARRFGVLHRVRFLEKVSPEDLSGLYSAADLGVRLTTDLQAQAEAMACRLPLAPPAEHLLAWWRDPAPRGIAARPAESDDLESSLTRLVKEPALRQMLGERLRRLIEAESDWPVQAQRLCRWYRELASLPQALPGRAAEPTPAQLAA